MSDDIDLNADVASPYARAETGDDALITDALVTISEMDAVGNPASVPGAHLIEDLPEDDDTPVGKKNMVEGADLQARYCFLWEERPEFLVSDLVWGKVKSHPWWPGQIFDPSCASELALRHHRKGNFLVAYYGDKTFAWCDSSQLKHLPLEFSAMEKQSSSEAFVEAMECALGEVSRRVELGLVCGCIPEEVHSRLKFRWVENAGIQSGVSLSVMNWTFSVDSFQPDEFLGYIRSLAVSPICGADRFGLTVAWAQLLAYNRSKGFTSLPDIFMGKGLAEDSSEMQPSKVVAEPSTSVVVADERLSALFSKKTHQKSGPSSRLKRKRGPEESRKSRRLSELMEYSEEGNLESGCEMGSHKKLQTTPSVKEDSDKGKKRKLDQAGVQETKSSSQVPVRSFKVGECIRRVASKLTSSPSFKSNGVLQKCKERDDDENESPFSLDDTVQSQEELHNMDVSIPTGSSLGELLCDLCIAAKDPMEITDFSSTVIDFFTGFLRFRAVNLGNSVCSPDEKIDEQRQLLGSVSGEDTKAPEERRRRRKHIPLSVSDGDRKESEEVKRKRGRPRLNSEGDAKQPGEGQRRRGRPHSTPMEAVESPEGVPRKRGQPRLSSTEKNNPPDEVPRKRGRPRLKSATDIKPGESVEHKQSKPQSGSPVNVIVPEVVKRKRGRPPNSSKVVVKASGTLTDENIRGSTIPEMDLSKTTPAYMNDSYWTDVVICNSPEKKPLVPEGRKRGRKRKQYLISSLDFAEKTAGEVTESLSPTVAVESLKQIQLPSLSSNNSGSLIPERRISYFGEKCIEESNPTAFILNFMDANSLPSETELVRTFSRYGPLKDAETEIQRPLSFAKVVFKRRADAEVAFLNARRYNFFGHSLLSFRLRSFPSTRENSINSSAEGKIDQTVVSSSSFSLSGHKSDEVLMNDDIQKAEVSESDEVLPNHTTNVLEDRITGDVDRSPVDVLDAEKGKTVVDSVYLDGNEMVVGQGDLEGADRKECPISVNASLVNEEGPEVDEKFVGDAGFVPTDGLKNDERYRGEIRLEDQSNGRDKIGIMDNDNVVPGREEYLIFGADFDAEIQGTERVKACVDCGSIESQTVKGVGIPECNGTRNKDSTVAVEDKTSGHNSALGELHSAEAEALREIDNAAIQDVRSIESLVGDAKLVVSGTERLVVVSGDLEVERMEVQACSDACSVILHVNREHQLNDKEMLDSSRLGALELSAAANLETIATTNECLEISGFKVDNVQVNDKIMGVSDGRMNEMADDTNIDAPQCVKVSESSIVRIDMSAHRGQAEGNVDVGVVAESSNTMASGCVIDGASACIMDNMVVNDEIRRVLGTRRMSKLAEAARSGLHGHGNAESSKFEKHLDAMIPGSDVHMGTGMMEARYAKPATIEVSEGMNDSDVNPLIMEVSDARRGVTFVSSVNQITIGHGDLDVGEIKECSISVYSPLGDEQGHGVDKRPAGNTNFVDTRGPKRGEAPHKMAAMEDQSNERDEIDLRGNDNVVRREYDLAFGHEFDVAIQGNKGVKAYLDGGSVGSQGVSGVEILENNDTVKKEDPAVPFDTDGISSCLAKSDKTTGSNCALGELDGAEAESLRDVINMVPLEAKNIESLVGDAKLVAFSTERLEMDSDDLEARIEVLAGSDACCVIIQGNQEHELKVGGENVQVPRDGEDEEIQTPEISKCPVSGNLGVIISETREMPREQVSCEVPKDAKESPALDMQGGERCQGTDGKGTIFASSLMDTESSVNETSVGAFCLNAMRGDGSNAEVVVMDGMIIEDRTVECPSISKSLVSDNIHASETLANEVASDVCRCGSKSLESEVLIAPEKHMEDSVITDDAPIKGKMTDSGIRAHVKAAYTGVVNIIGAAIIKDRDCGCLSVSVPSDLEVLLCTEDDELLNGGQLESAEVTEMAGKSDSYDRESDSA